MRLVIAALKFMARTIRNGAHSIIFIFLCFMTIFLWSNFQHKRTYSSDLHARYLTLDDLPADYVKSLHESVNHETPFTYNTTLLTTQIPRIIHQTYRTTDIPQSWTSAQNSCKDRNPNYEHFFWTDETARDFIAQHFEWFLPTYDNYPYPIERVDSIRYFLLWHFGGIYIDLDVSCRRSLDPLLSVAAWFPKTQPFGISNDVMASIPQHPIMLKLAMSLHDHDQKFGTGYTTVFWATGPMFVNNVLAGWFRAQHRKKDAVGSEYHVSILSSMFYDGMAYSFFGHRPGSSWHGRDVVVVKWLYKRLWWVVGGVAISTFYVRLLAQRKQRGKYLPCISIVQYQQQLI